MRPFQKIESRHVQNQPAAGAKHAIHLVERERVIHASVTQDIERKDEVEGIPRKGKFVHARGNELCTGLTASGKFQGVMALIYPGQIRGRKFLPHHIQHPASAATRIEKQKMRRSRFDRSGHMLAQRLVPPIVILDRAHDVVFDWRHMDPLSFVIARALHPIACSGMEFPEMTCHKWLSFVTA